VREERERSREMRRGGRERENRKKGEKERQYGERCSAVQRSVMQCSAVFCDECEARLLTYK
jgi:hypothetical protein